MLRHEGNVVEDDHVGVTDAVLGLLVGGGNGADGLRVSVLKLGVAPELLAGLLVLKLFYHFSAFSRFKLYLNQSMT